MQPTEGMQGHTGNMLALWEDGVKRIRRAPECLDYCVILPTAGAQFVRNADPRKMLVLEIPYRNARGIALLPSG